MADAKHGRRKQCAALAVAQLKGHTGKPGHVGIARAVDEAPGANGLAAGFGFHQQRADVPAVHDDGGGPGVKQQLHPGGQQPLVGRALVGRDIVGAHADAALHAVLGFVKPAQSVNALQQFVDHAMHDLPHFAVVAAIQTGEIGHAAGRAHAAQKAITLDQQRARAVPGGAHAGGQAGRAAAYNDDVKFAIDGQGAGGFGDK